MKIPTETKELKEFFDGLGAITGLERVKDDDLIASRDSLVLQRTALKDSFDGMGDDRFSTADGAHLFSDISVHDIAVRRIEQELQVRGNKS